MRQFDSQSSVDLSWAEHSVDLLLQYVPCDYMRTET